MTHLNLKIKKEFQFSPIVRRELEIKSRSKTLPVLMSLINSLLFAVGIAGASAEILIMKNSFILNYGAFLRIYAAVAGLEFVLILFTAPLLTAGSIAGERERGTFDLLLTTRLTAADIILEKLFSAWLSAAVIIISSLPALLIPLMFGGVHFQSTVFMVIVMTAETVQLLSVGMLSSSLAGTAVRSIAVSYAVIALLAVGPVLISGVIGLFTTDGGNMSIYLTVIDPLLPIASILSEQIGEGSEFLAFVYEDVLNGTPDPGFLRHAALIGIMTQAAISFGCITIAIMHVMPHKSLFSIFGRKKL